MNLAKLLAPKPIDIQRVLTIAIVVTGRRLKPSVPVVSALPVRTPVTVTTAVVTGTNQGKWTVKLMQKKI